MSKEPMTFKDWWKKEYPKVGYLSQAHDISEEAWQASESEQSKVIAELQAQNKELVEALEEARPSIHLHRETLRIDYKLGKISQPPFDCKELYEYDKRLLDKIDELIAKHKGQS